MCVCVNKKGERESEKKGEARRKKSSKVFRAKSIAKEKHRKKVERNRRIGNTS